MDDKDIIEIWKKTIDVQQHFNDIELRIRNLAITLIVAVLGVVAYSIKEAMNVSLFNHTFPMGSLILAGALPAWLAFYFMDRFWYHRLLLGAVDHALCLEKSRPELGLSIAIGKRSPLKILRRWEMRSTQKVDALYLLGALLIVGCSLALFLSGDGKTDQSSQTPIEVVLAKPR